MKKTTKNSQTFRKVLVVDDDESILDAISLILEDAGYIVKTTFKGEEVYKIVAVYKPDVILLDVLMSGSDGRQICGNLKQETSTKDIPIIMISAHPTAKQGAIDCGADDFLAKPFETEALLEKVANQFQI